jgi:uncharacterized protein YecE (DUF72 family)
MKADDVSLEAFGRMIEICEALKSRVLVFQMPGSFRPDRLGDVEEFFGRVDHGDLVLVWETRGTDWERPEVREKLGEILEKFDVTHVTDPFMVMPAYVGEVAYFRLHGLGERMYYYQFSDAELERLKELVSPYEEKGKDVYVLFNNLSMFVDGMRFAEYLLKGSFPKITGSTGLASVKEVLERARYPASKSTLIRKVGWKLVEIEEGKQIRLREVLTELPSKNFRSADEVLDFVKDLL